MPTLAGDKQMVLPTDTVMYQAQEVAAVVATTKYIAADGVAAVLVDYEPLPVIVDPHKSMEPGAAVLRPDRGPEKANNHIWHWESGDAAATDAAMAAAEVRVSEDIYIPRIHVASIETCGCVADWDAVRGQLTLHMTRRRRTPSGPCSRLGQRPAREQNIRVKTHDIGGGFGGKVPVYPGYVLAVVASPDRRQAGQVDRGPVGEPPGGLVRPRLPHPRRGRARPRTARSQALKVKTLADHGYTDAAADPSKFPAGLFNVITGSYDFDERVRRGRRRLHEQAARRRGLPLLVPRDRGGPRHRADGRHPRPRDRQGPGAAPDGELHPARAVPVQDADGLGVRLGQLPGRAPEGHGHDRLRRACARSRLEKRAKGELMGIGISSFTEIVGAGPSHDFDILGHQDERRRARSGSIRPARSWRGSASQTQGQGHETTYAQIIAEELGFPVADIKIEYGDTDTAPYGLGTYGSRSTPVVGRGHRDGVAQDPGQGAQARGAPARGHRGRPRVGARQVQRQGLAGPVQDHPGDRVRGLHQLSRRGWRWASRRSTTTTRRT